jgi:hypothetical protein
MKVGGNEIKNSGDFYKAAASPKKSSRPVSFYIRRGQANIFVAVTPEN